MVKAYSYIRFSTPQQSRGHSRERQLSATREYCERNGLFLDEKLMFSDLGISAFSGANVTTGKMGMFIKAAEEGMVPFGSVLIVESLDRLSRQSVFSHLSMFLDLINLGITLVTLMDNKKYTKEGLKNDPGELRDSIAIMQRAHDESLTKAKRGRAAWEG